MRTVFLDHQSSTPVLPEVFEAMKPFFRESYGNPSSLHQHGIHAREAIARARQQVAGLINASADDELIFTSGGTEAANLAVKGVAYANQRRGNHIVTSAIEHPAVLNSIAFLEQQGFKATRVSVDPLGLVDPDEVRAAMTDHTILVCVHHANHDVGAIQPIHQIAELTASRGVPLFVDAVASAGWLPIDVQASPIGLLSLSPHRFYGPKGVGVLYRSRRVRLGSILQGGDQEHGHRAGTENVPAIVGAGLASERALIDLEARRSQTARVQSRLWERLSQAVPFLALNGPELGSRRTSTNLNLAAEFTEGEGQVLSLDLAGIAVASGTSCVSKAVRVSPVLEAMGVSRSLAQASVIMSLGKDHTIEEMDYVAEVFGKVVKKLRALSPLWDDFQRGKLTSEVQAGGHSRTWRQVTEPLR